MDLPLTRYETWEHNPMADKYNLRITPNPIGGLPEPYQRATALFFYRRGSGYDLITQALKYGRNFAAGRHFAAMLGELLRESPLFSDVDLVVPVPLHWTRRLRRGYNQAEVIAREIARSLSASPSPSRVAFAPRILRRVRHTRTQTRVSSGSDSSSDSSLEARARNVAGAFAVRSVYTKEYSSDRTIKSRTIHHILLVDDVCTTASTLASCHSALRTVFGPSVRISVATLAFAE